MTLHKGKRKIPPPKLAHRVFPKLNQTYHSQLFWAESWPGNENILSYLKITFEMSKGYSMMPVVGTLTLKMSCRVGMYDGAVILSRSLR